MAVTIDSGIHFRKYSPVAETHTLVHASDGSSQSAIFRDTTEPNGAATFSSFFTDTTYDTQAHFNLGPDASVLYNNSDGAYVWSGTEARTPAFFVGDSTAGTTNTFFYDFTSAVNVDDPAVTSTLYRASDNKVYIYIGCIRPVAGFKFTIGTPNAAAATTAVSYWNGSAWTAVSSQVDNTAVAGATFAQTGTITFSDTVSIAKIYIFNNTALYFYQVKITGFTGDTITLTKATVQENIQKVKDIWDGTPRTIQSALSVSGQNIGTEPSVDATTNLATQNFVGGDNSTVVWSYGAKGHTDVSAVSTIYMGFSERMQGIYVGVVNSGSNSSNPSTLGAYYWSGTAWTSLTVTDNTDISGNKLSKPGWITWNPPAATAEQKKSFAGRPYLYYYAFVWGSGQESIQIDYMSGMPIQKSLSNYSLSANWQNRTVLAGEIGGTKPNSMLISAYGTTSVFNGTDSLEVTNIGDGSPIKAIVPMFTRYTGQFFDTLLICKEKETWVLDGTGVTNYHLYRVSDKYGCVAPETLRVLPVSYEIAQGIARHVAIWLSASGVVLFDGNTVSEIDLDIKNFFQREKTEYVNEANIGNSVAFIDEREREYHLIVPSGATTINTELVYSTKRKAWFKIDRGLTLHCGFTAYSLQGIPFVYGGTATGFVEQLEDPTSTTFDGTTITRTIQTRDVAFSGWLMQTGVRFLKMICRAMTTGATVSVQHYGDGTLTADPSVSVSSDSSGTNSFKQGKIWSNLLPNTFHSFTITNTTASNNPIYEPVALTGLYKDIGLDKRSS